jgi:hypothetical protein
MPSSQRYPLPTIITSACDIYPATCLGAHALDAANKAHARWTNDHTLWRGWRELLITSICLGVVVRTCGVYWWLRYTVGTDRIILRQRVYGHAMLRVQSGCDAHAVVLHPNVQRLQSATTGTHRAPLPFHPKAMESYPLFECRVYIPGKAAVL